MTKINKFAYHKRSLRIVPSAAPNHEAQNVNKVQVAHDVKVNKEALDLEVFLQERKLHQLREGKGHVYHDQQSRVQS